MKFKQNLFIFKLTVVYSVAVFALKIPTIERNFPQRMNNSRHRIIGINYTFLVTGGFRPEKNLLIKYVVSIANSEPDNYFGDAHFCAGTIVKPKLIVTAAHCVKTAVMGYSLFKTFVVIAGTPNRLRQKPSTQQVKPAQLFTYEPSVETESTPDIALILLKDAITIDGKFTAMLPLANTPPKGGLKCSVVGWGRIFENGPMPAESIQVDLELWPDKRCKQFYGLYDPSLLCANNPADFEMDSCSGDSGGPMICDGKLYGVVSFGIGCGTEGYPGFYVNVYRYRNWILEVGAAVRYKINLTLLLVVVVMHVIGECTCGRLNV